uniref:Uncharacterized protein n=1 Tax=Anguilla anguilla TaxID=7936 RepID=A0A0E9QN63_ANGAN
MDSFVCPEEKLISEPCCLLSLVQIKLVTVLVMLKVTAQCPMNSNTDRQWNVPTPSTATE